AACGLLTQATGTPWLIPAALLALAAMMIAAYRDAAGSQDDPGTTTTTALLLCFLLGVLAWYEHPQLAVALALVATALLHFKAELHGVIRRLSPQDIVSFLQFAIVTFIVLPVLPDRGYGPYEVLNPYRIWLMVVLISGLGLAGYAVLRIVGQQRGMPLLGVLGGMVSSTATTLAFSRHMRAQPTLAPVAAFVILVANLVVLLRLGVLASIVAASVLPLLVPVLIAGLLPGLLLAWRHWSGMQKSSEVPALEVGNPSEMRAALAFAALYAAVLLAVAWLNEIAGTGGLYLAAAVSGLTDVDAITLSTLDLHRNGRVEASVVVRVIVLAYCANLLFKFGMAWSIAGRGLAWKLAPAFAAVLLGLLAGAALV
ncbi:MAG TPA: DUF4010 domain-containing protein, partial [Solimonas sp.]|nr:DUF4010 domain-containing protein [Solimonas sp.]